MVETRRICLDLTINSRPVQKFKGKKLYVSTGDSDDMENGELVDFYSKPSRANVEPKVNDIIFAKMSNTDKTFLIDEELSKNIYSTGFFDISSKKILPKFLYYLIKSDEFDCYKNAYSEGTTQVSISDKRLKKIKITYETDLLKQQLIVNYLDVEVSKIECLINNLEEQIINLNQLKQSEINSVFMNDNMIAVDNPYFKEIPYGFKFMKINQLITKIKDGTHSSYGRVNSGEMLLSAKNVLDGTLIYTDNESMISVKDYLEIVSNGFPKKGDVLFTTVGTIGRSTVFMEEKPLAFQRSVLFVRPPKFIDPFYLSYFFRSDYFKMQYKNFIKQSAQAGLYGEDFKKCYVIYPEITTQKEIVETLNEKINKIDAHIQQKKAKMDALNSYKKSLIYECVTGKKEVI